MSQKFCKAQVFSADFLVATSIFLLVLTVVMIYWSYTNMQIEETKIINEMIDKAYIISQVWFREGTPKYWDSTDVREVGLLSDHRINETKMDEMKKMGYSRVKGVIGAAPYEFQFRVFIIGDTPFRPPIAYLMGEPHTSSNSKINILDLLNKSNLVWDFYQGASLPTPDWYTTARANYTNLTDPKDLMVKIIKNIDNYNSIILEHSLLSCPNPSSNCDLDSNNQKILTNWVNNSEHAFLQINKQASFLKIFGLDPLNNDETVVIVNSTDPIFKNGNIGEIITFQQESKPFDNSAPYLMKTIMYKQGSPSQCMFCRWWYGNGTIYYMGDSTRTDLGQPQIINATNPFGYNFVFGKYPTQARNVIKVERSGILNSSIAIIEVLLWR
jgi:hypothetical protein